MVDRGDTFIASLDLRVSEILEARISSSSGK